MINSQKIFKETQIAELNHKNYNELQKFLSIILKLHDNSRLKSFIQFYTINFNLKNTLII